MKLIKIHKLHPEVILPEKKSSVAAGFDVTAWLPGGSVSLEPLGRTAIPTGLVFELPEVLEIQVRPRSGLAINHGITLANSPGTIDADYRGELKILLINLGREEFKVDHGMRIAQLIFSQITPVQFMVVAASDELKPSVRGGGGFGHTGI